MGSQEVGRIEEEVVEERRQEEEEIDEEEATGSALLTAEEFDKKIEEIKAKVREAVQEALANTLADLLEKEEKEEKRKDETKAEELPKCPKNLSWLKKMFEILPLDILRNSKLWRYRHCVWALQEAEKEAEKFRNS
ncbi:hypothetical protein [Archaeoglobus profundus]|uniref:Exosome complex exonuclease n=2 Tax=Archaeoglobus profundus TaxID=84156 RepID=D2RIC6_ARCPA|nr:hypothetical protein [Archaeoglobus profundus]ACS26257.1 unknown [Archaeoglobus profundus]ADB58899.1 exosome complex exonuclease [Archaeoglobus profundus DSM 5631]